MEKKRSYSIKEVSRLLNIPKATIRYWDSEGLITPERNPKNEYREFSIAVAMELSNISFFRNIDIPVKELKCMMNSDISVQEQLLDDAQNRVERKMEELMRQAERIQRQKRALEEIRSLKERSMVQKAPVFDKVVEFDYLSEGHWQKIIENPGDFVLVFERGSDSDHKYGVGYHRTEELRKEERVIWSRERGTFYEGLLITDNRDEARNNVELLRSQAGAGRDGTGKVIAQYLASGVKGQKNILDYYKAWIEIDGKK